MLRILCCAAAWTAEQDDRCLEDFVFTAGHKYVPPEQRRNFTYAKPDGTMFNDKFRGLYSMWSSGQIIAAMSKQLIEQVFGINYEHSVSTWSSATNLLGAAGCKVYTKAGQGCDDYDEWDPIVHVGMDGWSQAIKSQKDVPLERQPIKLPSHAFQGVEGIFFKQTTLDEAFATNTYLLGYYMGWNSTAFPKLPDHFTSLGDFVAALGDGEATPLGEKLRLYDSDHDLLTYRQNTQDPGPNCYDPIAKSLHTDDECRTGGPDGGPLPGGIVWLSPQCRDGPQPYETNCVPWVSSSSWGLQMFTQWGAFYDMPLAIVNLGWGPYTRKPREHTIGYYWWWPDHTFASDNPIPLSLPEHDAAAYAGEFPLYKTGMSFTEITKWMWRFMEQADNGKGSDLATFLAKFTYSAKQMETMMVGMASGLTPEEVACTWLLDNQHVWSRWIPNLARCADGEGFESSSAKCEPCSGGMVSVYDTDALNNVCVPCKAGTYCGERATFEVPCERGHYCPALSRLPIACAVGTYRAELGAEHESECLPCPAGTYGEAAGLRTECPPCPAGTFAAGSSCSACAAGSYAEHAGTATCTPCPKTFTTVIGATSPRQCGCDAGHFWSRASDSCSPCRPWAHCPGGLALPAVYENYWGRMVDSEGQPLTLDAAAVAEQEAAKLAGAFAPKSGMMADIEVYECAEKVCRGSTIEWDLSAFGAGPVKRDRLVPLEGCPPTRVGIGCAKCEDNMYMGGEGIECSECAGGQSVANAVIVILTPAILTLAYKFTTSDSSARATQAFVLASTLGLFSFFLQTIAVMDSFDLAWPDQIRWLFDLSKIFMFDFGGISAGCAIGQGYEGRYWAKIAFPLYIMAGTAVSFVIIKVLPIEFKMGIFKVCSFMGMIYTSLYITLVKVVVAYFECIDAPYSPRDAVSTLAVYRDVECDSSEHESTTGAMTLGLILYVFGFYTYTLFGSVMAPKLWMEMWFRDAFRFMLSRWRMDVWYWGAVTMGRNLLMAIAAIVSGKVRVQLLYMIVVAVVYMCITATYSPWQQVILVHFDVVTCIILAVTGVLGLVFMSLQEETKLLHRYVGDAATTGNKDLEDSLAVALVCCNALFMASIGCLVLWCVNGMRATVQQQNEKQKKEANEAMITKFRQVCGDNDFIAKLQTFTLEATGREAAAVFGLAQKLNRDASMWGSGLSETATYSAAVRRGSGKCEGKPDWGKSPQVVSA